MTDLSAAALVAVDRGKNTQWLADAFGMTRREVIRAAEAAGYRHDPTSDTFQPTERVARRVHVDQLVAEAKTLAPHSKAVAKALGKFGTAYEALSDAVNDQRNRHLLQQTERELAEQLEQVRGRLGSTRPRATARPAATSINVGGATPAEVRAWAASEGIHVPPRGRVPNTVLQAYADTLHDQEVNA